MPRIFCVIWMNISNEHFSFFVLLEFNENIKISLYETPLLTCFYITIPDQ